MSAFEDFCIVCDKQCAPNSVYCSEECRKLDEAQSYSPTLSVCSSLNHCYNVNSASNASTVNNNNSGSTTTPALLPNVLSPLLTPQFLPRNSASYTVAATKSPQIKILSYESPMLSSTNYREGVNDLDSNKLDLNATSHAGTHRNSHPFLRRSSGDKSSTISNVSDVLDSCASENYKKWLSTH
ncbi:DEKNAAC105037 [Brettanomyces naardenensis]|uniref:DEKNAAC105037 n=1 Tax=Brettanomyces naardenensis TaxID=13370 RepID=A0A448YS99_BRENA|nr:DEKNAAC105037 [Brettanomyces naardenensis]